MRHIRLNKGFVVMVDNRDFDELSKFTWFVNHNGYAVRAHPREHGKKRPAAIFMHRQILGVPDGLFTDHINGDTLDNRRCNLRIATKSENNINRPATKRNKLGIKGITYDANRMKFRVRIAANGQQLHLGRFNTIEEAQSAYRKAATKVHGEFAHR